MAELDEKAQSQNLELRRALNDAYAFVEASKYTQAASAITFEDLMDQQIERLSGADTDVRPNALHRIDKIENGVIQAVAKIKSMPNDAFVDADGAKDANTPR
jgi:hypothetical protein